MPSGPRGVERRALFVGAVEEHGDGRAGRRDRALAPGIFTLVEHGAERELHHPVEALDREQRERAVADLTCDRLTFRALHTDDPLHVHGPRRAEALRVQHLDDGAVPLGLLAAQQRLDRAHVAGDGRPRRADACPACAVR